MPTSAPGGPLRLLLTLSALLPLIVFAVFAWTDRVAVLRQAERSAIQTVAMLHEHAQKVFETHELALRLVDERIRGRDWAEIADSPELFAYLQQLEARFAQIASVWIIAPDGRTSASSMFLPMPEVNVADRSYFQAIAAGAPLHISEVYRGRSTGTPSFSVALRRSHPAGAFDGVILGTVYVQYFAEFYASVRAGADHTISLTRADGHQLVREPALSEPVRFLPQSGIMRAIAEADEGTYEAFGQADGVERIFAFKKLNDYPVFVTFGVSKQSVLAAWRRNLLLFGAFALAATLALTSITWLVYKRVQAQTALQQGLEAAKAGLERSIEDRTAALSESEQRLRLATDAAELGAFEWHLADDRTVWENDRMYEIFQRERAKGPIGRAEFFAQVLDPADLPGLERALSDARASGHLQATCRIRVSGGSVRWIEIVGRVEYGANGRPLRLIGMVADVTDRRIREEHLRLLMAELNHRVKNTLASVQSMAFQTGRSARSIEEFRQAYWARLGALARAHDVLTRRAWEGALLSEVVTETLTPYGLGERIDAKGPPVKLAPNAAVTISMVLHELATNAVKYGALSVPDGMVRLEWMVESCGGSAVVAIAWREENGPPVKTPTRAGFGSRLVRQAPTHELDATVALDFDPTGVRCVIRLPLSERVVAGDRPQADHAQPATVA